MDSITSKAAPVKCRSKLMESCHFVDAGRSGRITPHSENELDLDFEGSLSRYGVPGHDDTRFLHPTPRPASADE